MEGREGEKARPCSRQEGHVWLRWQAARLAAILSLVSAFSIYGGGWRINAGLEGHHQGHCHRQGPYRPGAPPAPSCGRRENQAEGRAENAESAKKTTSKARDFEQAIEGQRSFFPTVEAGDERPHQNRSGEAPRQCPQVASRTCQSSEVPPRWRRCRRRGFGARQIQLRRRHPRCAPGEPHDEGASTQTGQFRKTVPRDHGVQRGPAEEPYGCIDGSLTGGTNSTCGEHGAQSPICQFTRTSFEWCKWRWNTYQGPTSTIWQVAQAAPTESGTVCRSEGHDQKASRGTRWQGGEGSHRWDGPPAGRLNTTDEASPNLAYGELCENGGQSFRDYETCGFVASWSAKLMKFLLMSQLLMTEIPFDDLSFFGRSSMKLELCENGVLSFWKESLDGLASCFQKSYSIFTQLPEQRLHFDLDENFRIFLIAEFVVPLIAVFLFLSSKLLYDFFFSVLRKYRLLVIKRVRLSVYCGRECRREAVRCSRNRRCFFFLYVTLAGLFEKPVGLTSLKHLNEHPGEVKTYQFDSASQEFEFPPLLGRTQQIVDSDAFIFESLFVSVPSEWSTFIPSFANPLLVELQGNTDLLAQRSHEKKEEPISAQFRWKPLHHELSDQDNPKKFSLIGRNRSSVLCALPGAFECEPTIDLDEPSLGFEPCEKSESTTLGISRRPRKHEFSDPDNPTARFDYFVSRLLAELQVEFPLLETLPFDRGGFCYRLFPLWCSTYDKQFIVKPEVSHDFTESDFFCSTPCLEQASIVPSTLSGDSECQNVSLWQNFVAGSCGPEVSTNQPHCGPSMCYNSVPEVTETRLRILHDDIATLQHFDTDTYENDVSFLMQTALPRNDANLRTVCPRHSDYRCYWDAVEIRQRFGHGFMTSQVWFIRPVLNDFQQRAYYLVINTLECIRCTLEQRSDIPTTLSGAGPYWVRPQPTITSIQGAQQFLYFEAPKPANVLGILVCYTRNEEMKWGTLAVMHVNMVVSMQTIFDAVNPNHRCHSRAWCRVRLANGEYWWPDPVPLQDIIFIQPDEIDPPTPSSVTTSTDMAQTRDPASEHPERVDECTDATADSDFGVGTNFSGPPHEEDEVPSLMQIASRTLNMHGSTRDLHADSEDGVDSALSFLVLSHALLPMLGSTAHVSDTQIASDLLGTISDWQTPPQPEDNPDETPDPFDWTVVHHAIGIAQPAEGESMRIFRPTLRIADAKMLFQILFQDAPQAQEIIRTIEHYWQDLGPYPHSFNQWFLQVVDASLESSCAQSPADQNFIVTNDFDGTLETQSMNAFLIEIQHLRFHGVRECFLKAHAMTPWITGWNLIEGVQLTQQCTRQHCRIFRNGSPWQHFDRVHVTTGSYIVIVITEHTRGWSVNPSTPVRMLHRSERSRSPMRHESEPDNERMLIDVTCFSPRMSPEGQAQAIVRMPTEYTYLQLRQQRHHRWTRLGDDNTWAPVLVHPSHRDALPLQQFHHVYILWDYGYVPLSTPRRVILIETLFLTSPMASASDVACYAVSKPMFGVELLFETRLHNLCTGPINYHCEIWHNGRQITPEQRVETHHGDFARVVIFRSSQIASYALVYSASSFSRAFSAAEFHCDTDHIRRASRLRSEYTGEVTLPWDRPTEGLRPPGNGVRTLWLSRRMDCMDTFFQHGDFLVVVDDPTCEPPQVLKLSECMPKASCVSRRQIQLSQVIADMIPPVQTPCRANCTDKFDLEIGIESLACFMHEWNLGRLDTVLPCPSETLNPFSFDALLNAPLGLKEYESLTEIHFYVDGSFVALDENSAWAIVATASTDSLQEICLGWKTAQVVIDEQDPQWMGATSHSAFTAEQVAIFFAGWWALSAPDDIPLFFHFDNIAAGFIASGHWQASKQTALQHALRAVHQLLDLKRRLTSSELPTYEHVKAHDNHPWNELCDTLAKTAVHQKLTGEPFGDYRSWLRGKVRPIIGQLPLLYRIYNGDPTLPMTYGDSSFEFSDLKFEDFSPVNVTMRLQYAESQQKMLKSRSIRLRTVTYNVLTLKEDNHFAPSHRAEYLRAQLAYKGAHVVALQETRANTAIFLDTPEFLRFVSPAKSGHGGTELWFNKQMPIADGVYFQKDDFQVLFATAEVLLMVANTVAGRLVFLSAHAPHSASPQEIRLKWWRDLMNVTTRVPANAPFFFMADCNAEVGEETTDIIGTLTDPQTNHNGTLLISFLKHAGMWLPSTFQGMHIGSSITWRSAKCPNGKRLDYVAISQQLTIEYAQSWVDYELDAGQQSEDHSAVFLEVSFRAGVTHGKKVKHRGIDRTAIRDPLNAGKIHNILMTSPQIAWEVDAHQHYQQLTDHMFEALSTAFPAKRQPIRRSYISESSWFIWKQKVDCRQRLHESRKNLTKELLQICFSAWACILRDVPTMCEWDQLFRRQAAHGQLQNELASVKMQLDALLKKDRLVFLENVEQQVQNANPQDVYAALRHAGIGSCFRKKGKRALPILSTDDGTPAQTPQEAQEIWKAHAQMLEFGSDVTAEQLWMRTVQRQIAQQPERAKPMLHDIPTLQQLEAALRRVPYNKATGPDGLIGEVFHLFSKNVAFLIQPLLLKTLVFLTEPLQAKGGSLVRAYKGSVDQAESYRGLLIENHLGKVLHSAMRKTILPFYELSAQPMQLGGRRAATVTHGAHIVRSFLSWTRREKLSAAVLFVDIKTAFYRVVRPLVSKLPSLHQQLIAVIERFQLPHSALQELYAHIDEESALRQAGASPFQEHLFSELHTDTWFHTPLLEDITATIAGTRPGDPLADLAFNLLFARLLRRLNEQLADEGLLFDIEWNGVRTPYHESSSERITTGIMECAWADDLAVLVRTPSAGFLEERTQAVAAYVIDLCLSFGLTPNLKKGKTEIIFSICGKDSIATRKRVYATPEPQLLVQSRHWGPCNIRIVTRYVHLGGLVSYMGSDKQEIYRRLGHARSLYDQYKRRLFQSNQISLETKRSLLPPLIMAALRFGMGLWTNYSDAVMRTAESRLIRMYQGLLRNQFEHARLITMSHNEVIARVQLPPLRILLHVERLRHFGQLVRNGPAPLWALLACEQNWLQRCQESLAWLYEELHSTIALPHPCEDWDQWRGMIVSQPGKFLGWLKRAQLHATLQITNQWCVKHWQAIIVEQALIHLQTPPWIHSISSMPSSQHICGPCGLRFATQAAWSVHAFKKHNRVNPLRAFAQGTVCQSCAREYFRTTRLVRHLQYSQSCAAYHRAHFRPSTPAPGRNSKYFKKHEPEILSPPIETAVVVGQALPLPYLDDEAQPHATMTEHLLNLFETTLHNLPDFSISTTMWKVVGMIKDVLISFPIPYTQIELTFRDFRLHGLTLVEGELGADDIQIWKHAIDVVAWRLSPAWLVPTDSRVVPHTHREAAYNWLQQDPVIVPELQPPLQVPRMRPERFIVHFYAGRRRKGDLQEKLEALSSPPGVTLHIISLDIIYGPEADLFDPAVRKRWLDGFHQKRVLAFFAGPPCESWSRARFVQLTNSKVRPIRSAQTPWGLVSLAVRELRQVLTANVLMLFSLLCLTIQSINGHFGMVEHPARPHESYKPSIWNTRLWSFLKQLHITELAIAQGYYGAISSKPTILAFALRLPWLEGLFRQFRTTQELPKGETIGRNDDGTFRTAILKEYPEGLNSAIAAAFDRWHSTTSFMHDPTPLPTELLTLFRQFEISLDATLGQDYVPTKAKIINVA